MLLMCAVILMVKVRYGEALSLVLRAKNNKDSSVKFPPQEGGGAEVDTDLERNTPAKDSWMKEAPILPDSMP